MQQLFVQFGDATEAVVIAVIGGRGDPEVYPYQGVIGIDDHRYGAFFEEMTPFAKANAGLPVPQA
jgi:hypothetical protein